MSSPRVMTFTAVTVGAVIGAVAALASSRSERPPGSARHVADYAPISSISRSRGNPAMFALERPAAAQAPSSADGETRLGSARPPESPVDGARQTAKDGAQQAADVEAVALSCARGDPDDCLRAADVYEQGRGVPPQPKLARDFLAHAIRKYTELCTARDPAACASLAELHAGGRGVPKSEFSAAALRERALQSCRVRPHSICRQLEQR